VLKFSRGIARGVTLALAMVCLIVPGTLAQSQAAALRQGRASDPYWISVNVDLVVLHPTVRDRKNRFVADLREQDFEVYEDGVRQPIRLFRHEDIPITVGLVVDHSGSMQPKLSEVIAGARAFAQSSNPNDQMFVVNFNEKVTLGLPGDIPFTHSPVELERAILKAPATGETALYDAIVKALERLQQGARDKKVLVVISDGADNTSVHNLAQVLQTAAHSSAIIYTVGLFATDDRDANPRVLSHLTQATGGQAFVPEKLDEVVAVCERIARDIRSQYTIGYVSTNPKRDGLYRAIRVAAQTPGHGKLSVRIRPGYIAGTESRRVPDEAAK